MRNYTDDEILDRIESLPTFLGWKKGVYDFWMRNSADGFNIMDDKVFTYEVITENVRPKFIMKCTGTTNAGAEGLKHFEKYNKLGCAVAVTDVLVYGSHVYGLHGKTKYPAYIQRLDKGPQYPYTRDNDKDDDAENYGKVYTNRIGMNCHKAGRVTYYINGNSVACLVRNVEEEFNKWMKFMNKRPLNLCVLTEF